MWSLGISLYQIITGEHPFDTRDEIRFRDELSPRLRIVIENLLKVDMYKRWDANMVLSFA
jgi:serine/threonine protein kinase